MKQLSQPTEELLVESQRTHTNTLIFLLLDTLLMKTEVVNAYTKDKEALNALMRDARDLFNRKGVGSGGTNYAHAPRSTCYVVVVRGEEPEYNKDNWAKEMSRLSFEAVDQQSGSRIYYKKWTWQSRIDFEADDFLDRLDIPESIVIQKNERFAEEYSPGHTPFSYDPNNDYYTEP